MDIKPGSRWRSAVCNTEVIVVRAPKEPLNLGCGGVDLIAFGQEAPAGVTLDPANADGTQLGKRYADEDAGTELLCTKPGAGSLTIDGVRMPLKDAKPLPSSD